MTAFGGYHVQGQNIQREAIADMAGIKCMLGLLKQKGDGMCLAPENRVLVW